MCADKCSKLHAFRSQKKQNDQSDLNGIHFDPCSTEDYESGMCAE